MSSIQLDYSDITDIFKEKLKIDNIVKKVSSIISHIFKEIMFGMRRKLHILLKVFC